MMSDKNRIIGMLEMRAKDIQSIYATSITNLSDVGDGIIIDIVVF